MTKNEYKLDVEQYRQIGASDCVLNWLENGVPLPFKSEPQQCFNANRVYSKHQEQFVDSEIERLSLVGAIVKTDVQPHCVFSMRTVPKKNKKLRLVVDCRPINVHLDVPSFSQEGISAVSESIQEGDILMTCDI